VGLDLADIYGNLEVAGVVMNTKMYSHLTPATVALWTAVVVGIVIVSALYPALRAARLEPVEAMRHV
jgi:ABC-type lipoprotein release transport system permease subunit